MRFASWVGRHIQRRTIKIIFFAAAVLTGLIIGNFGTVIHFSWVVVSACLFAFFIKLPRYRIIPLIIFGLLLGVWRGGAVKNELMRWNQLEGQKVALIGEVKSDAAVGYRNQLEFTMHDPQLELANEAYQMNGEVSVQGFGTPSIRRGDILRVNGEVNAGYGSAVAKISFAELDVIARNKGLIESVRRNFFAGVHTALPEPHGSLGLGFLVGLRVLLPEELLNQLSRTGLTHIVAVSGYNLTILIRGMRRTFAEHSKFIATATSIGLMIAFLAVTGFSPSISRAVVVSSLALGSWYYGRNTHPGVLIAVAAALTAFVEPTYLWSDIGWYLSFFAFFGVLVLAPLITKRIFKNNQPGFFTQLLIETSAAQIFVTPIIAMIFSEVSLIAIPANLIVLPFIPFAMMLTFVAGLGGMLLPMLSGWVAWPAEYVLSAMLRIVEWFASLPWAAMSLSLSALQMLVIYAVFILISVVLYYKINRLGLNVKKYNIIE